MDSTLNDLIGQTVLEQTTTTVMRSVDREHYTGQVDGVPFRFKIAGRETAQRERDAALRRLAAWQAILDEDLAVRRHPAP